MFFLQDRNISLRRAALFLVATALPLSAWGAAADQAVLPPLAPWDGASRSLMLPPDHPWVTPAEASGLTRTPSYDETFAHRIMGGADVILVPSRFEPCGLTQLYGLRYGTLPIVRKTGGLADTVKGYTPKARGATGFVFETASALALQRILQRALAVYRDKPVWQGLMRNAMQRDFGWQRAAEAYVDLYTRIARD